MKESVEHNLKKRISEVFDSYEDNSADLGWQELRKRYPARQKQRTLLWSSAAAILLICGTGYLFSLRQKADSEAVEKTGQIASSKSDFNIIERPERKAQNSITPEASLTKSNSQKKPEIQKAIVSSDGYPPKLENSSVISLMRAPNDSIHLPQVLESVISAAIQPDHDLRSDIRIVPQIAKAGFIASYPAENQLTAKTAHVMNQRSDHKGQAPEKKLALTFYAGTFMNYAEGSDNTINVGAGVSTGIALSKSLTLSTGLAIAKNTLVFDDKLPVTSFSTFRNNKQADPATGSFAMIPAVSSMNAELLNLDIPVIIRYDFNPNTRKLFIAGGLTSSSYISETYTYSYNNFNLASNAFGVSQDEKVSMSLAEFDFARTLNLSVGMTYDLGKKQNLTVEPFVKYPLGGLGSQNIVFGAAGVNLKILMKHAK
ncbi:MAG TPA: outer membrane beta-barrel protein [Sphingobacteriaceae bacterium]